MTTNSSLPSRLILPGQLQSLSSQPFYLLLATLLLIRGAPSSLSTRLPWAETADKRKERKRLEALTPLTTPALEKEGSDLFLPMGDGSRTLLVPYKGRVSKVKIRPIPAQTFAAHSKHFPPVSPTTKLGVNANFLKQLRAIMIIILPRIGCRETFMVFLYTLFLLHRSLLSVLVARLDGRIVRNLISADAKGFIRGLGLWFVLAVPSTYTNAMINHLQAKLALAFRTRLTRYVHDLYLSDKQNFYKLGLGIGVPVDASTKGLAKAQNGEEGDGALGGGGAGTAGGSDGGGADQFITHDVARFCDTLSALYGNILKPVLDLVIFTAQLSSSLGPTGTIGLFSSYAITAYILRAVTPAFGRLAAVQARLEGEYRACVGRVGRDAEEIAFFRGGQTEKDILMRAYRKLMEHVSEVVKLRVGYLMVEDFVLKYLWSAVGYSLMSLPVFLHLPKSSSSEGIISLDTQVASRTEGYISSRRLLISLADAGGRLLSSYKDIAELSGSTARVYSLISSLHALNTNLYPINERPPNLLPDEPFYDLSRASGRVFEGPRIDKIELLSVPIVVPACGSAGAERGGEELIKELTLTVESGNHTFISGPNGAGKSSIARIIAKLWPIWSGTLNRPSKGQIFFLPQRPYLSLGSLRDQVIYPHSYAEMKAAGRTESELMDILKHAHLAYLPSREGGWETRKEWADVLSGGEKQRMAFARLFYHQPSFAVLDDCTSAVSTDVEGPMYQHAQELGITLITISHRPSLMQYHKSHLRLFGTTSGDSTDDSPKQWELSRIGDGWERISSHPSQSSSSEHEEGSSTDAAGGEGVAAARREDIGALERELGEVEIWSKRLEEIKSELNGGGIAQGKAAAVRA